MTALDAPRGPLRVIEYAEDAPARNMAWDAALLACGRIPTLRLYGWRPHGVSLGHFQRETDAAPFLAAGLPVVRRMTGGGAIVHAFELTYALLTPDDAAPLAGIGVRESYAVLHAPVRAALAALGVGTELRPGFDSRARDVLCFARATELDVLHAGRKLVGSAQRRTPGRVLQHGSIILRAHALQPGTAAVSEAAGRAVLPHEFAALLAAAFREAAAPWFGGSSAGAWTEEERRAADAEEARLAAEFSRPRPPAAPATA